LPTQNKLKLISGKRCKTSFLVRANNQSAFAIETNIIVDPIEKNYRSIFETNEREQMHEHPNEPSENTAEMIIG